MTLPCAARIFSDRFRTPPYNEERHGFPPAASSEVFRFRASRTLLVRRVPGLCGNAAPAKQRPERQADRCGRIPYGFRSGSLVRIR